MNTEDIIKGYQEIRNKNHILIKKLEEKEKMIEYIQKKNQMIMYELEGKKRKKIIKK